MSLSRAGSSQSLSWRIFSLARIGSWTFPFSSKILFQLENCVFFTYFPCIFRKLDGTRKTNKQNSLPCEITKPWSWLTISFSRGRYYGRTSRLERTAGRQLSVAIFVQIFFFARDVRDLKGQAALLNLEKSCENAAVELMLPALKWSLF